MIYVPTYNVPKCVLKYECRNKVRVTNITINVEWIGFNKYKQGRKCNNRGNNTNCHKHTKFHQDNATERLVKSAYTKQ